MAREAIFRWAAWSPTPTSIFMLDFSVATFKQVFGEGHRYVVVTDDPPTILAHRRTSYEVLNLKQEGAAFDDERATWRKWAPAARLDARSVEFRIDADIFLLRPSDDLDRFCDGRAPQRFVVSQEEFSEAWPYGNFAPRLSTPRTPINAGFVGQAAGADLSLALDTAYALWLSDIESVEVKYHDEQGAVAYALEPHIRAGEVLLLDPARHRVVCPLNDPPVEVLDGLTFMHATYPDHPAFYRFLPQLSELTGLASKMPDAAGD